VKLDDVAIDAALRRLGEAPVHPALAGSSMAVLAQMAARRAEGPSIRFGPVAAVAAVAMGLGAAAVPAGAVEARPVLSMFGPAPPLAPSTLLIGGR